MARQAKEWKNNKDGTPETMGQRQDRLQFAFNAKAGGSFVLAFAAAAAFGDGISNYPVLYGPISLLVDGNNNLEFAKTLSRIVEISGCVVAAVGSAWAGVSAALDVNRLSAAERDASALGRDYRPGDNKKTDARLAAAAAEQNMHREVA